MRRTLLAALSLLAVAVPATAQAADPPAGTTWTEQYLPSPDGTTLHADVLRPSDAGPAKQPVLMVVSPYVGHSGATPTEFNPNAKGPSDRFFDFYEQAGIFKRGYTVVQVDLRGYGGSNGCGDWGGPGEQADVKAAVEWAAAQPFSNGKVALYGKSYDGWTGIMGLATRPKGLAAVISQEPVVDGYRYIYINGIHYSNTVASSQQFSAASPAKPGATSSDSPQYVLNDRIPGASCATTPSDLANEAVPDPTTPFWAPRNLLPKVKGADIPLFLYMGFLEDNTKPDHVWDVWNSVTGPKRGWFGQWDHIRGTDGAKEGKPLGGRLGFAAEAARFLDHYVKGLPLSEAATDKDPPVAVQAHDGSWRQEAVWPPADGRAWNIPLQPGSFPDEKSGSSASVPGTAGAWTVTQALPHDVHISGIPKISIELGAAAPQANIAVVVYDVDAKGKGEILTRSASAAPTGTKLEFELYAQDWVIPAGHKVAVHLIDDDAGWLQTVPSNLTVEIAKGTVSLPALEFARPSDLDGKKSMIQPKFAAATIDPAILAKTTTVTLPAALKAKLTPAPPVVNPTIKGKLTLKVRKARRKLLVSGISTGAAKVTVKVLKGRKMVAKRTLTVKATRFKATLKLKRAGRYTVVVSDGRGLTKRSKLQRVR